MSNQMGRVGNVDSIVQEHDDVPPLFRSMACDDDLAGRIREAVAQGDHEKAAVLLRQADRELAADPAIPALHIACLKLADRKARFETALQEAEQEFCDDRFAASLGKFREAVALSRGYARFAQRVCDQGLAAASKAARYHWRFAAEMIQEIGKAESALDVPASLAAEIDDRKREETIRMALDESGRADHTAYLPHVRRRLAALAGVYPGVEPLQARLHVLDQQLAGRAATDREKNLQRLILFRNRLDFSENSETLRHFSDLVAPFVNDYPGDPQFTSILAEVRELQAQYESAVEFLERKQFQDAIRVCNEALERRPANLLLSTVEEKAKSQEWNQRLANSVVARARHLEEAAQYGAAWQEWESLQRIEPRFPGLESEILHCAALKQEAENLRPRQLASAAAGELIPEILPTQPVVETTALTVAAPVEEPEETGFAPFPLEREARPPKPPVRVRIAITTDAWNNLKTGAAAALAVLLVVLVVASNGRH